MTRFALTRRLAVTAVVLSVGLTGCGDSPPAPAKTGGGAAPGADTSNRDPKTGKPAAGRPVMQMGKSGE